MNNEIKFKIVIDIYKDGEVYLMINDCIEDLSRLSEKVQNEIRQKVNEALEV